METKNKKTARPRAAFVIRDMNQQRTVEVYDRIISVAPVNFFARKVLKLGVKDGKALDIACGPGHLLCALARLAPKLELHGVDISPNMLKAARKKFEERGLDGKIQLHLGSAYDLPFKDNTFDLVTNTLALHCLEKPQQFFEEFVRVMKPDGKGMILAYTRNAPGWIRFLAKLHSRYMTWRKIPLDGMGPVLDSSYTVEEIEGYLQKCPQVKWQIKEFMGSLIMIKLQKQTLTAG